MATPIPALVARVAASAIAASQFLPRVALGLLFVAIASHWIGLDGPSRVAGAGAFFALALAVVLRREPL